MVTNEKELIASPVIPVSDPQKMREILGDNPQEPLKKVLKSMSVVVPEEISLKQIEDIIDKLITNPSSSFNKIITLDNEVIGFLVCEEMLDEQNPGSNDLYIKYFGFSNDSEISAIKLGRIVWGNIVKLIKKSKNTKEHGEQKYNKISLHGFNKRLNRLLMEKFDFKEDQNKTLKYPNPNNRKEIIEVPYLFLDLSDSKIEEKKHKTEIDLSEFVEALMNRRPEIDNQDLKLIKEKVIRYLANIQSEIPPNGWSSLADVVSENYEKITQGMGIDSAIKFHQKNTITNQAKLREELASNPASKPELLASSGEVSLFNLINPQQLKEESANMTHCVGESDHYINRIVRGETQIWSLRNINQNPLLTIEYDVKKCKILQMKKQKDKLLTGEEEWFKDLLKILQKLNSLNIPFQIEKSYDLQNINLGKNDVINSQGEFLSFDELIEKDNETIIKGNDLVLTNEMSKERILFFCKIKGITVNTTKLNQENKDLIKYISGNLKDESSVPFSNLVSIGGSANFLNSKMEGLGNLETIGGSANFTNSQIKKLGKLKSIGRYADFLSSSVEDLGSLESIGEGVRFTYSNVEKLGNLKTIGGDANFMNSKLESLGSLESIGGKAYFSDSSVKDMGSLKSIGDSTYFSGSKLENLGGLKTIRGNANFSDSKIINLGSLETIGGYADFENSKIKKLGGLKTIGGNTDFRNSLVEDLGSLESIGGNAHFSYSKIKNLERLKTISGNANFLDSKIINLGSLETIGGDADFRNSFIDDLGYLETIEGYADFSGSKIKNLGKLKKIGGAANFKNSKITNWHNVDITGMVYSDKKPKLINRIKSVFSK